jgi:transposase-like protein
MQKRRIKKKVLPETRTACVDLYNTTDMTYSQIADRLGIRQSTVGSLLTMEKVERRKARGGNFSFPARTKDPRKAESWGRGFWHMNIKLLNKYKGD